MKYLLDANVLCEPTKPVPVQKALIWLQANVLDCVIDAIVLAEIWQGIDALPQGRKRANLEAWFEGLRTRIQCLDWTADVALRWDHWSTKCGALVLPLASKIR
jgi:toxin FitB